MGYTGYALLFLEEDEPERASRVYLRAKDYGLRALGDTGAVLKDRALKPEERKSLLQSVNQDRKAALIWTTVAWSAWINLNLDRPSALAQLGHAKAFLDRVMALDPAYFNGLPHIMMGVSYAARPPMMGGDIKSAGRHFRKALELTDRQFFLAQYYFARYYAVRAQDKSLFLSLVEEVKKGNEKALKEACLMNTIVKVRMKKLEEMIEELFL
jgi:hypothetical protein